MKTIPLSREVEDWLSQTRGECYCDSCIAKEMEDAERKNVQDVTSRLGCSERGFCKYHGKCTECGKATLVTGFSGMWV